MASVQSGGYIAVPEFCSTHREDRVLALIVKARRYFGAHVQGAGGIYKRAEH